MTPQLYQYRITPLRVVDGDTLQISADCGFQICMTDFVRLNGVDTPELHGSDAIRGKAAKAFTEAWVAAGKTFFLISDKYDEREKYGRILGRIYRDADPVSLNVALVEAGHVK